MDTQTMNTEDDFCTLAKKFADGSIDEDEFIHRRTKLIHLIASGDASNNNKFDIDSGIQSDFTSEFEMQLVELPPKSVNKFTLNKGTIITLSILLLIVGFLLVIEPISEPYSNKPVNMDIDEPHGHINSGVLKEATLDKDKEKLPKRRIEQSKIVENSNLHQDFTISEEPQSDGTNIPASGLNLGQSAVVIANSSRDAVKNTDNSTNSAKNKKDVLQNPPDIEVIKENTQTKTSDGEYTQVNLLSVVKKPVIRNTSDIKQSDNNSTAIKTDKHQVNFNSKTTDKPTFAQLDSLVVQFIDSYENGDLDRFSSLFSASAKANDQTGLKNIRDEYKKLFNGTSERQFFITDMKWWIFDKEAEGDGKFELLISSEDSPKFYKYSGNIKFTVKKIDGQVIIEKLIHNSKLDS